MSTRETPAALVEIPALMPKNSYTGENITILEGLEAVRLRPAMYIGSTGEQGLHHLVYEVVDNSVDEALAGHATRVEVTIHIDNTMTGAVFRLMTRFCRRASVCPQCRWCSPNCTQAASLMLQTTKYPAVCMVWASLA